MLTAPAPPPLKIGLSLAGCLLLWLLSGCGALPFALSAIPTADITPTPSATSQPSPTVLVTATPLFPAQIGTPLPTVLEVVSAANVGGLTLLAQWGEGIPFQAVWSADGGMLAVVTTGGLYLYRGSRFEPAGVLGDHLALRSVAFSADGEYIAAGSREGRVYIWRLGDDSPTRVLSGQGSAILSLAFSPDGSRLASASWDRSISIWDTTTWDQVATLDGQRSAAKNLAFSSDGAWLFSWGVRDPLLVWEVQSARQTRSIFMGTIGGALIGFSGSFSPEGNYFAVNQGFRVRIHRTADGTTLSQLTRFQNDVDRVALSPAGELAATVDGGVLRLWQAERAVQLWETPLAEGDESASLLAFSPDGRMLVGGEKLRVWAVADQPAEAQLVLPAWYSRDYRLEYDFAPDGRTLALASVDGSWRLIRTADGAALPSQTLSATAVNALAFSTDHSRVAIALADNRIQMLRLGDDAPAQMLRGHRQMADCLAFSPDGSLLASGAADRMVMIWEVESGRLLETLRAPAAVSRLVFSPDGLWLAVNAGNEILLWRTSGWSLTQTLSGRIPVFSSDGKRMARLIVENGRQGVVLQAVGETQPLLALPGEGSSLTFSPQGDLLAVSGLDVSLWDTHSGQLLQKVENPAPHARVGFSPDGKLMLLSAGDGRFYIWGVP